MPRACISVAIAALLVICSEARAQENSLMRSEVSVIKKKLVGTLDALGQPPAGDTVEQESYNLPTDISRVESSGMYYPVNASASRRYGTQKASERAGADLQNEYQKKMLDAQAKGDYQEMARLAQEVQQKAAQTQSKMIEGRKDPTEISVQFNSNPGTTIDPDAVVLEKPGMIALRSLGDNTAGKVRITMYFDPVSLKDTKELSRVDMKLPEAGVAKRTTVLNISLELNGPTDDVEPWVKRIEVRKVLGQIDAR